LEFFVSHDFSPLVCVRDRLTANRCDFLIISQAAIEQATIETGFISSRITSLSGGQPCGLTTQVQLRWSFAGKRPANQSTSQRQKIFVKAHFCLRDAGDIVSRIRDRCTLKLNRTVQLHV
jgi:hypothetical protein